MANATNLLPGARVRTWDGHTGTVLNVGAWVSVRIDGETTTHDWQPSQLEVL